MQRHSKILELYSMKEQGSGMCQRGLAPYWPQLSYCLSIQTRMNVPRHRCVSLGSEEAGVQGHSQEGRDPETSLP